MSTLHEEFNEDDPRYQHYFMLDALFNRFIHSYADPIEMIYALLDEKYKGIKRLDLMSQNLDVETCARMSYQQRNIALEKEVEALKGLVESLIQGMGDEGWEPYILEEFREQLRAAGK